MSKRLTIEEFIKTLSKGGGSAEPLVFSVSLNDDSDVSLLNGSYEEVRGFFTGNPRKLPEGYAVIPLPNGGSRVDVDTWGIDDQDDINMYIRLPNDSNRKLYKLHSDNTITLVPVGGNTSGK